MGALSRVGDIGTGVCPKEDHEQYTTQYITGAATVFVNNLPAANIGTVGTQSCSDLSEALTGSPTVFVENVAVHRIGDTGIGGGGDVYTSITGSPTVFNDGSTGSTINLAPDDAPIAIAPAVQAAATVAHTAYMLSPQSPVYQLYTPDDPTDSNSHQVKTSYPGTPDDGGQGEALVQPTSATGLDIVPYLTVILDEANRGAWKEQGVGGNPSNPNIIGIWRNLGYPSSGMWLSDQTAWCMGFVNYVLKNTGYHYIQTARANDIQTRTAAFHATPVSLAQAQPGDICLWSYSHVNFVYSIVNGKLTFVGGNQSDKAGNNPSNGSVTNSYPKGYTNNGTLIAVFRPSKI